jgi:hypothetical protein
VLPGTSTNITTTFNATFKGNFNKTVAVKIAHEEAPVIFDLQGNSDPILEFKKVRLFEIQKRPCFFV